MKYIKLYGKHVLTCCLALVFAVFIGGALSFPAHADDGTLEEARNIIKTYYVNDVPDSVLNAPTIEDMVNGLNDPHSMYFTAQEYEDFVNSINNQFSGIGVHIDVAPEGIKVVSVIAGSPAEKMGVKAGDIIISADGHSLAGLSSDEATSFIKGDSGTTVHIEVLRDGNTISFDIERSQITSPTVGGTILDNHIGYLEVSSFGENTALEFKQQLEEINKSNPDSYIVDLRYNGGGYLATAIELAGYFIPGKTVVNIRDKANNEYAYTAPTDKILMDKPIIFLTNKYSASASEILTGAVKDYKKAFIVGTNTYGKGTVQTMFQLSDGSVLKLTVDKFFSPYDNVIDKVGIKPDLDTGDGDALDAAVLLLGKAGTVDKSDYVKLKVGDREFEIDSNKAKLPQNWKYFKSMKDMASEVYSGTKDGWVRSYDGLDKLIYSYCKPLPELNGVPADKKFTVKFSDDVDLSTINDSNIEIIDASTGERISSVFEQLDGKSVRVTPSKLLNPGGDYYMVIHSGIKGKRGFGLKDEMLVKIKVNN